MLLVHQVGSVKIGEVVRYTLTYTPSRDRILPSPSQLFVKVKNTSAIPLRAAYLHGPYTLYAACYPSIFDPNHKHDTALYGTPEFEPNLKAGGSWLSRLTVPESIRETAGKANVKRTIDGGIPSCTWIVEVSSQVIFSTSATVHFELLIGRDEKSVELGFSALTGQPVATPGQLQDHQQGKKGRTGHGAAQPKGVFSTAVDLVVDDTESLWRKPALPERHNEENDKTKAKIYPDPGDQDVVADPQEERQTDADKGSPGEDRNLRKQKKIHLVILTHGLHSNLGADMLYLKESIDAAAKQAREDARARRAKRRGRKSPGVSSKAEGLPQSSPLAAAGPAESSFPFVPKDPSSNPELDSDEASDNEEEVIVRGFSGNAVRTERGIQYLGKRLAKYVLSITHPDQPFLPIKKSMSKSISRAMTGHQPSDANAGPAAHVHSSIHRMAETSNKLAYRITSISFVAHSLGGLTQTYAIAYIYKHTPHFFDTIKPINFVALASPFLGLSNENPLYVKFALDFGLVGRTGQDLGLTWRAPTMVRSGWGAMIGGIGNEAQKARKQPDPGTKPLLRILPTGPAHHVLKLFRNRTVYSNVVNDGIVPLRTSCLLFLDWSGLGRVEKARRENGLVGTMAGWGWSELTGANSSAYRHRALQGNESDSQIDESGEESSGPSRHATVPQPSEDATQDDNVISSKSTEVRQPSGSGKSFQDEEFNTLKIKENSQQQPSHPFGDFLNFGLGLLRPSKPNNNRSSPKQTKIYKRSQTTKMELENGPSPPSSLPGSTTPPTNDRPGMARGNSVLEDPNNVFAPPKTTVFESAGDILNPPLPSEEYLVDPVNRPRTIFHDRVYHPGDIPPPPVKKRSGIARSFSGDPRQGMTRTTTDYGTQSNSNGPPNTGGMKVEEKIARAYHSDLSWRKVLVRLEPDAHNNICVRRMFANAYGWPVVKHLVDTHFADTFAAATADVDETNRERAKPMSEAVGKHGEEVSGDTGDEAFQRSRSESHEANDNVTNLESTTDTSANGSGGGSMSSSQHVPRRTTPSSIDTGTWDDALFAGSDDEDDDENENEHSPPRQKPKPWLQVPGHGTYFGDRGTPEAQIADFLSASPATTTTELQTETQLESKIEGLHLEQKSPSAVADMPETLHGYTTSVGLGRSVKSQLSELGRVKEGGGGEGVVHEVTRKGMSGS
ncbi:MAG: hypothetical protein Q9190_004767 [Brigantiaea leucoxantha]